MIFSVEIGLIVAVSLSLLVSTVISVEPGIFDTTAQRIATFNYPVEIHEVQTNDGYVLTIFRIPNSPKETNGTKSQNLHRPIVLLQHGILSSSDCFILNGPDNALAYLLADEGFDVWLANSRGNTYGRKNVNISTSERKFWDFSWQELGTRDLPATIDYVLNNTDQEQLHFVAHSQGTTCFLVLMSEIPSYNTKIKTAHMLAPVGFMNHLESPIGTIPGPILGYPSIITELVSGHEVLPNFEIVDLLGSIFCVDGSWFQWICSAVIFITGGWDSKHLNYTLLPQVAETHPAGTSTGCFLHYYQEYISGYFRKYDYGKEENMKIYGQESPPNYDVKNIKAPVRFYYGDNDFFASVIDVKRMEKLLPNLIESYNIPVKSWNHYDFLWAIDVKKYINDKIIKTVKYFEKTKKQL